MKKLLALLLLFGIVGCATVFKDEQSKTMALMYPASSYGSIDVDNYKDMKSYWRAEAMNLETGKKVFYGSDSATFKPGQVFDIKKWVMNKCENRIKKWGGKQDLGIRCVLSRYQDEVYYQDLDSYKSAFKKGNVNSYREAQLMSDEQFKKFNEIKKARQDREKEQKEIILAGLISRCENFGWSDEDNIAACVQQEAYRDLQIEKQRYEIKVLEQKLATVKTQTVDDEPLFLMFLNAYADSKKNENMNQMKRDIIALKSKSTYSGSSAEAALKSLYRDSD
tara:strand:+ start:21 stop:857 length:837 start_codon:yes stop_codon:yes gene_type:complete